MRPASIAACLIVLMARDQARLPSGDAANGKTLVASKTCLDCHRIGETGSRLGPDLSDIGSRRSPDALQRAIVFPDEDVLPEQRFVRLVNKDGAQGIGRR